MDGPPGWTRKHDRRIPRCHRHACMHGTAHKYPYVAVCCNRYPYRVSKRARKKPGMVVHSPARLKPCLTPTTWQLSLTSSLETNHGRRTMSVVLLLPKARPFCSSEQVGRAGWTMVPADSLDSERAVGNGPHFRARDPCARTYSDT